MSIPYGYLNEHENMINWTAGLLAKVTNTRPSNLHVWFDAYLCTANYF